MDIEEDTVKLERTRKSGYMCMLIILGAYRSLQPLTETSCLNALTTFGVYNASNTENKNTRPIQMTVASLSYLNLLICPFFYRPECEAFPLFILTLYENKSLKNLTASIISSMVAYTIFIYYMFIHLKLYPDMLGAEQYCLWIVAAIIISPKFLIKLSSLFGDLNVGTVKIKSNRVIPENTDTTTPPSCKNHLSLLASIYTVIIYRTALFSSIENPWSSILMLTQLIPASLQFSDGLLRLYHRKLNHWLIELLSLLMSIIISMPFNYVAIYNIDTEKNNNTIFLMALIPAAITLCLSYYYQLSQLFTSNKSAREIKKEFEMILKNNKTSHQSTQTPSYQKQQHKHEPAMLSSSLFSEQITPEELELIRAFRKEE